MHVPAPKDDTPFKIGDTLTIYEAAMIYADRHPYPHFFVVNKNSSIEDLLEVLKLGLSNKLPSKRVYTGTDRRVRARADRRVRARVQKSWDIYCELMKRVKHETIIPINGVSYDRVGKIDPRRTRIRTSDLADLAAERGERPRCLRHLSARQGRQRGRPNKTDRAKAAILQRIEEGKLSWEVLSTMKGKALAHLLGVSRTTATKARKPLLNDRESAEN
jgi:hypothetical protein